MGLYSKNHVCNHCQFMLQGELQSLDIPFKEVGVGFIEIEECSAIKQTKLNEILKKYGLQLMHDNKSVIIDKIKNIINELINGPVQDNKFVLSAYISEKLNYNYTYLYNLFSAGTGMTIKWYEMVQKIERVKYLLVYEQLPITEITYMLNYSSVAHLSSQFKKVTGYTPSEYKNLKTNRLSPFKKQIEVPTSMHHQRQHRLELSETA